jgi:hypothetical protein
MWLINTQVARKHKCEAVHLENIQNQDDVCGEGDEHFKAGVRLRVDLLKCNRDRQPPIGPKITVSKTFDGLPHHSNVNAPKHNAVRVL